MKKSFLFLSVLIVVLSSLFVSCSEGDIDTNNCKITVEADGNGIVSISGHEGDSVYVTIGGNVEVVATPNMGYTFEGWFVSNEIEAISDKPTFAFTASADIILIARFKKSLANSHEFVDLGLPSGIKWATCNVGAGMPWEYGGYYAWGETEEKEVYNWDTYKFCINEPPLFVIGDMTITKYCNDSYFGSIDGKYSLDSEDDVAHIKWGGGWRMPTSGEQDELLDECSWKWTTLNGTNGYEITGPNGNSIFLPASGLYVGNKIEGKGVNGRYWSSGLAAHSCDCAYQLDFNEEEREWFYGYYGARFSGQTVRPVLE